VKDAITGAALSIILHSLVLIAFTWFTFHPGSLTSTVIDLSLLVDSPPPCPVRADKPLPRPPSPRIEPRAQEPRPSYRVTQTDPAPSDSAEPQVQPAPINEKKLSAPVPTGPVAPVAQIAPAPAATGSTVHLDDRASVVETARQRYLKEQFAYIRDAILAKLGYPGVARRMGWTGTVKVSFCVHENGSVTEVKIIDSSGYGLLDNNAVDAIMRTAPFPCPPVRAEMIMPITYRLD